MEEPLTYLDSAILWKLLVSEAVKICRYPLPIISHLLQSTTMRDVLSLEAEIEDLKAKLAAIGTGGRDLEVKPPDDVKKPIEDCESQEQPLDDSTLKSSVNCHI